MPTNNEINKRIAEAVGWSWWKFKNGTIWVVDPRCLQYDLCDEENLSITVRAANELVQAGKIESVIIALSRAPDYPTASVCIRTGENINDIKWIRGKGNTVAKRLATALYRALGGEG